MTTILLGFLMLFQQLESSQFETAAVMLCADPVAYHTSIVIPVCYDKSEEDVSFGICWSTAPNPTIFGPFTIFNQPEETFEFRVESLTPNTPYYFSFFKMYRNGTTDYFSPFEVQTIRELKLGDYHQGGIVCYIYKPKDSLYVPWEQHGLIISKEDLGYAAWGMHGKPIAEGTSIALGHGKANTEKILKQFGSVSGTVFSTNTTSMRIIHPCAALLCDQYVADGYDDWFLPSKGEIDALYVENYDHNDYFGLNPNESYWTSSEVFISFKLDKTKRKDSTSHHRRAWQSRIRSQSLIVYTMVLKKSNGLVRAMRYF